MLTDEQIDAVEAGEACDMAVAAALRLAHERRIVDWGMSGPKYSGCIVVDGDRPGAFRPSTDWNDAMFAAEKFGLFVAKSDNHCHMAINIDGVWDVAECVGGWEFDGDVAKAPTGPLAICRAILKLENRKN